MNTDDAQDEKRELLREDGTPKVWLEDSLTAISFSMRRQPSVSGQVAKHLKRFLTSICIEFCFQGEVVMNGKLYKKWSSLRAQVIKLPAQVDHKITTMSSQEQPSKVAQRMLDQLLQVPVDSSLGKESDGEADSMDDERNHQALFQKLESYSDLVPAISQFKAQNKLISPVSMHPAKAAASVIFCDLCNVGQSEECSKSLEDLLRMVGQALNKTIPADWVRCAADVQAYLKMACVIPSLYAAIFENSDSVMKFLSLRSQYALHMAPIVDACGHCKH